MHIPAEVFQARLISARTLAPAVREMVFARADGHPFRFLPGQWANLVLPLPSGEIKRAYSIASAPAEGSPSFEIAVTRVTDGPGSQYLHELPVGAELRAIGPQGLFTRLPAGELSAPPSLFVGTGTGVTPLRSMMRAALAAGAREPLWLLFGARFEEDVLYRDEIEALVREHPNVRYEITLSRPGPSWAGRRGYVQEHLAEILASLRESASAAPHAYVCGLDRMVSAVRESLRSVHGLDRKHVHTERYD
jgi:ferredoxin-NADP reductase